MEVLAFPSVFLSVSFHCSIGEGGSWTREAPPPPVPRLQSPSRSSGPPGLLQVPNPHPHHLLNRRPPCPASGAPKLAKSSRCFPSPPLQVGPLSRLSSSAAPPGTGAGSPGRRFQGTGGGGGAGGPRRPPGQPAGPSLPRHPTRPGPPPGGHPALTSRRSPPGRQQKRRRGIQRPRPGPGRSAARRSAAQRRPPRPRESSRKGAPCWRLRG